MTSTSTEQQYFSAQNIYKERDTFRLFLSFQLRLGGMTAIVGPSGSGKSTVLRIIAGLEKPTENTEQPCHIFLDAKDITQMPPAQRGVGMVFQDGALFMHMTVQDNVAYGLRCKGLSAKEARMQAVNYITQFGLQGFEKRYPETLSGGEAQRVSLARTLIVQPKLVLFDEPFSALDAPLKKKLAADIKNQQAQSHFTGILVTHDIQEAQFLADTIILLKQGNKHWEGSSKDFREDFIKNL
ncbi:MAG: ABC transporter ATP-binding protein [Treponema sp.]|nr:ABC transporter ATP-binding protein [Treponema sp.]